MFKETDTTKDKEILKIEYKELCEDWRLRDKYVLDKLSATAVLFALLGLALATVPADRYLIRLLIGIIGTFFALILSISTFKDIYFRNSTEVFLKLISQELGITYKLTSMASSNRKKFDRSFWFGRKLFMNVEETMEPLKFPKQLKIKFPIGLKMFLRDLDTFNWIFYFYSFCFIVFLVITIVTILNFLSAYLPKFNWIFYFCFFCSIVFSITTIVAFRDFLSALFNLQRQNSEGNPQQKNKGSG